MIGTVKVGVVGRCDEVEIVDSNGKGKWCNLVGKECERDDR